MNLSANFQKRTPRDLNRGTIHFTYLSAGAFVFAGLAFTNQDYVLATAWLAASLVASVILSFIDREFARREATA